MRISLLVLALASALATGAHCILEPLTACSDFISNHILMQLHSATEPGAVQGFMLPVQGFETSAAVVKTDAKMGFLLGVQMSSVC